MLELKTITHEGVPSALLKAQRYRLLGEPDEAESICMDILAVAPDRQEALVTLILSLTDKFASGELQPSFDQAMDFADRLAVDEVKTYYQGIIYERRAKYHYRQGGAEADATAYSWFAKAMNAYGQAMSCCDPDNQDSVLRWNSCVRFINNHPELKSFDAGATVAS